METLEVGEVTRLRALFTNADGTPTNPTTVTLFHTDPSGNQTTVLQAALTNPSAGDWYYDLAVDEAGVWAYRFEGTGTVAAGETKYFLALAEGTRSVQVGPCDDWISPNDVFDCAPCSGLEPQNLGAAADAAAAASRVLFELSGRRYPGICLDTVRPCSRCEEWPNPLGYDSSWGTCSCQSSRARHCGCPSMDEVRLGGLPVLAVTSVVQDGVVLTAGTHYRLDDHGWLVRIDGQGWPSCQRLDLATTEDDTWAVTFAYGRQPPADAIAGAKALACEFYQACSGGPCALPKNVQSIVRQGVEIGIEDVQSMFEGGRTGVYLADLFLEAERVGRARAPATVVSPDSMPRVRRAGT